MTDEGVDRPYRMLINGELVGSSVGSTLESINPTTERPIAEFPVASAADVDDAVESAKQASAGWSALGWEKRSAILREFASRLTGHAEALAQLDARDAGLTLAPARDDVKNAVKYLNYYAGIAGETKGFSLPSTPGGLDYTVREPYGVVGRIVPFNHPAQFAGEKIAAPLAAGNAVVLKPGEHTSLSALRIGELVRDLFPPGVLNIVTGTGADVGRHIVEHPDVPRIGFTGSVPTAVAIMTQAAPRLKRVSLELGGKNPMIVFPDVDVSAAAAAAIRGMNFTRCQGQSCGSYSRLFVHDDIHDRFVEELKAQLSTVQIGDPTDEQTQMGPLAFGSHYARVLAYVESARQEGAQVALGGARPSHLSQGFFLAPTLITEAHNRMRVAQEEIFGPVMTILRWRDRDEVIAEANDVEYGLTANVWTNNLTAAHDTVSRLHAGYVWVNGNGRRPLGLPFGGYKHSGIGKEAALEDVLGYTQEKAVSIVLK